MPQVPLWVPILVAAVGVLGAIGGAIAGALWKARGDVIQWRRNLKVETYRQYATVTTEFLHGAVHLYGMDPNPVAHGPDTRAHLAALSEAATALRGAIRSTDVSGTLTQMIAPSNVQREVARTQLSGERVRTIAVAQPRPAREEWDEASMDYLHAQDRFLAEVQRDLGFTGYVLMPGNRPSPSTPISSRRRRIVVAIAIVIAAAVIGVVLRVTGWL